MKLIKTKKVERFTPTHLPFVFMYKNGLDSWEKMKNTTNDWSVFHPANATYISVYDLNEKARTIEKSNYATYMACSIWQGEPGCMSPGWVNKNSKRTEYSYRFNTGSYQDSSTMLLVDDMFEWAGRRRESKDVRSAWDIIVAIKRGELIL